MSENPYDDNRTNKRLLQTNYSMEKKSKTTVFGSEINM